MKKNVIFSLLVMGLVCCFAACGGNDPGGSEIPVKVKAHNNNGIAPASISIPRAVGGGRGGLVRAVDHASFNDRNGYYDTIGTKVGSGITPTKFHLGYAINAYLSDGTSSSITWGIPEFDFTEALTVDVGNVPTGITVSALEMPLSLGMEKDMVQFTKPSGLTAEVAKQIFGAENVNGDTITCPFSLMSGFYRDEGGGNSGYHKIMGFIYYGDERKQAEAYSLPGPGGSSFNTAMHGTVILPFSPVNIPESASSATLDISWNLNGIIEQWSGKNNTPNDTDDIFIFKKGWWNTLYVVASVQ